MLNMPEYLRKYYVAALAVRIHNLPLIQKFLLDDNKNEKVLFHFNIDKKTGKKNFNK